MKDRHPCACRGHIEVELQPDAVAKAVRDHQRTDQHVRYVDRVLTAFQDFAVPDAVLRRTA